MSSSLILHNNNEPFLSQIVSYVEKWILYDNRWQLAQWLNRDEAPKHFPKPNLHQKKRSWSLMVAACLIHSSFLNPSETITSEKYAQQIDEMHRKLQLMQPASANRMAPVLLHDNAWLHVAYKSHNQCFKSWTSWATKLCLICHIHLTSCQPPTTSSSNTTSWRQNASTTSRRQKMLSKSLSNPEAWICYTTEINKHISHWQKCVDCNGSYSN